VVGQALLQHEGRSIDRIDLSTVSYPGILGAQVESIYFDITEGFEYKSEVGRSQENVDLLRKELVNELTKLEKDDQLISRHLDFLRDGKERAGLSQAFLDHLNNCPTFDRLFTEYYEKGGNNMMDFLRDNFFQHDKILANSPAEKLLEKIVEELRILEKKSPHLKEHFIMFRNGKLWDDDKKRDFIFATMDTDIYEIIVVLEERTGKNHEEIFREMAAIV
jgi:hypothetical protein